MPMHEVLAKELCDSATVPFKLEKARENGTLPSCEGVLDPVLPVAVLMDGVAYSQRAGRVGRST